MSEILTDLGDILSVADGTKQYTGVEPIQVDNVLNKISIDESAITGKDWTTEINEAVAEEARLRYENDQVLQNDINTRQTWINWNTAEETEEFAIDGINTDEGFIGFKDNISNYATKTEVEGMISSQAIPKSELDNLATKDELTAYPTKSEVSAELEEKQDSLTFGYTENKISTINGSAIYSQGGTTGTSEYIGGEHIEIDNFVINAVGLQESLSESQLNKINNAVTSTAGLATETWVQNQNYITGVDLSNYYTKSETSGASQISNALNGKQASLTNAQLSALSSVSSMYNMLTALSAMVSAQWTLEAGAGITITNDETEKKSTISLT